MRLPIPPPGQGEGPETVRSAGRLVNGLPEVCGASPKARLEAARAWGYALPLAMADTKDTKTRRLIAENRRARYDFEFLETLECGLELKGTEVKSLRQGQASIVEAFGLLRGGELWLLQAHIPEYSHGNIQNHVPTRDRRLLVHKRELKRWTEAVREKGITIVPLQLYFLGARVKVEIALARGRKLHDKREREREKNDQRDMDRAMSRRR